MKIAEIIDFEIQHRGNPEADMSVYLFAEGIASTSAAILHGASVVSSADFVRQARNAAKPHWCPIMAYSVLAETNACGGVA